MICCPLQNVSTTVWLIDQMSTYLFQVEEDGIKAEEHESNSGSEPPKRLVVLDIRVEPSALRSPLIGLMVIVIRVRCAENEGVDASNRGKASNATDGIVEPERFYQIAEHGGVHDTCYTSTARDVSYSKASPFGKPCRGD